MRDTQVNMLVIIGANRCRKEAHGDERNQIWILDPAPRPPSPHPEAINMEGT